MKHRIGPALRAMKFFLPLQMLLCVACLLLNGCFAPLIEGARQSVDAAQRGGLESAAIAGGAEAQYKLGMSYCCEQGPQLERSLSVYDNQQATEWLCKAALQNFGPAQYQLAALYAGKATRGGVISRVGAWIDSGPTAPAISWVWASLAANNGVKKAPALRDTLSGEMSDAERRNMWDALANWRTSPCQWKDVMLTSARR